MPGALGLSLERGALHQIEERLRSLMIRALAGDEQPYRQLLMDIADRLRAYFGRRLGRENADIEDLVQETLLAIHQRRFTYDIARPFTVWLHAIARYKLIDHLRKNKIKASIPIESADELAFETDVQEPSADRLDVEQMLGELPAHTSRYIRAVKIDGRSIAEVSSTHGVSESAVKVAIHRGMKFLALRFKGTDR
jgi:RNA polymerase sigma-70 factor (ECF subfamily)